MSAAIAPTALPSPSLPLGPARALSPADRIVAVAQDLLPTLAGGVAIDARRLRAAMEAAFGGSDAEGLWTWKAAYEACEAAHILFLRRFGRTMRNQARGTAAFDAMLAKIAAVLPTQTRRTEESQSFQQFSTPIGLAHVVAVAAAITPCDLVLEPSAGMGLLAIFAELAGARLALNELADTRADLLGRLFPGVGVTRHDAAQIHDHLDAAVRPSVILMNPPFSALAGVDRAFRGAAFRHIASALARLAPGGRLVAITGAGFSPESPSARDAFERLQESGRVVLTLPVAGRVFARHGTTIETRLTVIDRLPAEDPRTFPDPVGMAETTAELLAHVAGLPARAPCLPSPPLPITGAADRARDLSSPRGRVVARIRPVPPRSTDSVLDAVELAYNLSEPVETASAGRSDGRPLSDSLYEGYALQTLRIPNAKPHPTTLVQSVAMASVAPPSPSYRPRLPASVVADGQLSDAQLESMVYAGEAHAGHLAGSWLVDATYDNLSAASEDQEGTVRFRRVWFLGDGSGCGKGRQVAGIILDNWLQGRRRALWVSKSDKLIEDAQRDWSALGQERLQVTPLSRFAQGRPIRLDEGILFTTYATLRSAERDGAVSQGPRRAKRGGVANGGKASRLAQIVEWLGPAVDGVVVFDEAHAMQNAGGVTSERGDQGPSQQGRAGLRLQHALPDARVLYVSATGATTVHNLAYAQRLGLWGCPPGPYSKTGSRCSRATPASAATR